VGERVREREIGREEERERGREEERKRGREEERIPQARKAQTEILVHMLFN